MVSKLVEMTNEYVTGICSPNHVLGGAPRQSTSLVGERKIHKHKQICGIAPGLGGCQIFVYVFVSGHSLGG